MGAAPHGPPLARAPALPRDGREAARSSASSGCASCEGPYTIALAWTLDVARAHPGVAIESVGTDADAHLVERARRAVFAPGSVRELPEELAREGLGPQGSDLVVRADVRALVGQARDRARLAAPRTRERTRHLIRATMSRS